MESWKLSKLAAAEFENSGISQLREFSSFKAAELESFRKSKNCTLRIWKFNFEIRTFKFCDSRIFENCSKPVVLSFSHDISNECNLN